MLQQLTFIGGIKLGLYTAFNAVYAVRESAGKKCDQNIGATTHLKLWQSRSRSTNLQGLLFELWTVIMNGTSRRTNKVMSPVSANKAYSSVRRSSRRQPCFGSGFCHFLDASHEYPYFFYLGIYESPTYRPLQLNTSRQSLFVGGLNDELTTVEIQLVTPLVSRHHKRMQLRVAAFVCDGVSFVVVMVSK